MSIFAQPIPYFVLAAIVTLIGVIYSVNRTTQNKKMEIEEARRIRAEELDLAKRDKIDKELNECCMSIAQVNDHFTIGNMQSMYFSENELSTITDHHNATLNNIRRMKATALLNDDEAQHSLAKLESLTKDFRVTLTTKSVCRTNGQNEAANAELVTANRIIGQAHVEIKVIKEKLDRM